MNDANPLEHCGTGESLPIGEWCSAMKSTVDRITELGRTVLETHRKAGARADEMSRNWKLEERVASEREALRTLFASLRVIFERIDSVKREMSPEAMQAAADVIKGEMHVVEDAFVEVRHASLDLLRWVRRWAAIEESTLPDEYRRGYAAFTSFAPAFRPALEGLQEELVELANRRDAVPAVKELLSAITRFNGVLDTARRYIQAVVEPPLELVFQETSLLLEDLKEVSSDEWVEIASALNDTCQFLLYDKAEFKMRVGKIRPQLVGGIDSSLYSLSVAARRVLFSVDEDPVFGQLTVTLYRVADKLEFNAACEQVIKKLYRELI